MATILLGFLCVLFFVLNGRNDGAPLVALSLQSRGRYGWIALAYLAVLLIVVPFVGIWGVADSLDQLMSFGDDGPLLTAGLLGAVLLTVLLSNLVGIPTSITLALVGALAGRGWALDGPISTGLLVRVLVLGLLAPLIAAALAYLLGSLPLLRHGSTRSLFLIARKLTMPLLLFAYAANDGQKLLFIASIAVGLSIEDAARQPVLLLTVSMLFVAGTLLGMQKSGRFIRHGVASVRTLDLFWVEVSASLAVLGGAAAGVPLSMTQSLTGGVAGVAGSRSTKSIYWSGIRRIGLAWVWTLPVSALIAFLLVTVAAQV